MNISFTPNGWSDYTYWQENDPSISSKIIELIRDISRDPFRGLGKPEALKGPLSGYMSRRITKEHRLVYKVNGSGPNQAVTIVQARFHYD